MKKTIFMCVAAVLFISLMVINFSSSQTPHQEKLTDTTSMTEDKSVLKTYFFAYQVDIHSAVLSDSGSAMTFSELSWQMHFQPHATASTKSAAMLSDIVFMTDNKLQTMPAQLPFLVKYQSRRFTELDMLGLNEQHPLFVVSKVLDLMSYSLESPLTFEDALGVKTFQYIEQENVIERVITAQQKYADNQEQELWKITVNKEEPGYPLTLEYDNKQIWQRNGQRYEVVQTVTVTPIKHTSFDPVDWVANHNQSIQPATPSSQAEVKVTNDNFISLIQSLQSNLDPNLAKEIGLYMLKSFDQSELKALFKAHDGLSSAFIYALQKAQTMQAEQMISDLLTDDSLGVQVQQKLVMALGRFENASDVGFSSLRSLVEQDTNTVLSDMALLSMGTMSKFSPAQSSQVADYLAHQMQHPKQLSTAILAMANTKNPVLIAKLPELLHHSDAQVRKNTIKSLGRMADYQDQVVTSLLSSPQMAEIDAFARVYQQANYKLSAMNIERLEQLYQSQTNPVIKKRLSTIMNM
ncbi:HEAT repeat domain-containing protein [Pseudoalteromonas luteoviolacea]|uniref:Vitellogenin domain-containing protein n=1 Tax=Pseudoalteromonas luteoviolacea S4054 TaxID=1129367 RepID=A0A0F6A5L1_9GAMM|nr:HEAT repeat domain-containing protein [Pseudoalteromonas luteoviolacea]AOT07640.1 hypothetical protein S4054249_07200 [Pseudoalteromonas luteoviolacea]AOT12556.1 hypothetical protein S40542_07200 [Pseudoalteromonas luteoviolacea]AOT17470.1 hypothetical protein S4054_07200 [Pseudoalteromonas luteoviolacea]KKE81383.1 hypothetical protein N479_22885 [Pseudoalteromonas luteoviolacea S4054]KZN70608.1 hypothetical protein N481_20545 [Pseudoalteromonas luteoviolacea S4047-1]